MAMGSVRHLRNNQNIYMNKFNLILSIAAVLWVGCIRKVDEFDGKVSYFTDLAKQQEALAIDAQGNFTEMVRHQNLADFYRNEAHRYKDSIFELQIKH
jgi:hypothetical protein